MDALHLLEIAENASVTALHIYAASVMAGIARSRVVGDPTEEFAFVAVEVIYNRNGWALIGDDAAALERLARLAADPHVPIPQLAEALGREARPCPNPD